MTSWDEFALEDAYDHEIEAAAMAIDCDVFSTDDDGSTGAIEADPEPDLGLFGDLAPGADTRSRPESTIWRTTPDLIGHGTTSRGDAGDSIRTVPSYFGDHTVSRTSSGDVYRTYDDMIGDGRTTYGPGVVRYHTTKWLIGEGETTRGSDGSVYETTKDMFGKGRTTRRKK